MELNEKDIEKAKEVLTKAQKDMMDGELFARIALPELYESVATALTCLSEFKKLQGELKSIQKLADNYDEFKTIYDPECQLPDLADRVANILAEILADRDRLSAGDI